MFTSPTLSHWWLRSEGFEPVIGPLEVVTDQNSRENRPLDKGLIRFKFRIEFRMIATVRWGEGNEGRAASFIVP